MSTWLRRLVFRLRRRPKRFAVYWFDLRELDAQCRYFADVGEAMQFAIATENRALEMPKLVRL